MITCGDLFEPTAPAADGAVVWTTIFQPGDAVGMAEVAMLDRSEVDRIEKFSEERMIEFVRGRSCVKRAIAAYLDCDPFNVQIGESAGGKPVLVAPKAEPIWFNLSHSANCFVVAVSKYFDVGIDVEPEDCDRRIARFSRKWMSDGDVINGAAHRELRRKSLVTLWVVKEATLKLEGSGLRRPLDSVSVDLSSLKHTAEPAMIRLPSEAVNVLLFSPMPGFCAALAYPESAGETHVSFRKLPNGGSQIG